MREKYISGVRSPKIYVYTEPGYMETAWSGSRPGKGLVKVGYTERDVEARMKEHYPTKGPGQERYVLLHVESAITEEGLFFTDHAIHRNLVANGIKRLEKSEWFEATVDEVKSAILAQKLGKKLNLQTVNNYKPRPEQTRAVKVTSEFFKKHLAEETKPPHFLWNAKMRFGKTFTAYQLAKEMKWKRVMVLTYKPAVEREWRKELEGHADFTEWQFLGRGDSYSEVDESRPLVWFASFQDILGKSSSGGIKDKFEIAHAIDWDCIMLDEYHFGAWRESAKELYDADTSEKLPDVEVNEETFPLSTNGFLYLSGTPFRALADGEFLEDQIFTWSYIDEQREKEKYANKDINPYEELPQMVMMTYALPEEVKKIALRGELNEFDLNEFFKAEEVEVVKGQKQYKFNHEYEVQQWLGIIRGQYLNSGFRPDSGGVKPPLPFADQELLASMNHSFWFLPSVAACYAMESLLRANQNNFFNEYKIIVAAGTAAGIGVKAVGPVEDAIGQGLDTKSITLSCGKLTTGVSIAPWGGIFMLRNTSSPETYFQAAFRVQTPWALSNIDQTDPVKREVLKNKCYIFDFAPNRALKLIENYSSRLDLRDSSRVEEKVQEFLKFLPVLSYDGFSMTALDARELLNIAASGIGATMLARRWQSDLLIRVDNETLSRLLANPELVKSLENVEDFANLYKDLTHVVNTEKSLNKLEKEKKELDPSQKREKKENSNWREELRKKLKKLVMRLPLFMYLTDYREESLDDVIRQIERSLFTKVTGITIDDFEKLSNIGVFNARAMNEAVYDFRRFEAGSLNYAGGGQELETIGLFDTKISAIEAY